MRLLILTLLVLVAGGANAASQWPASKVKMGDAETLQTKFDEGDMQSAIRTVVGSLPASPTNLNQTYIVTDGATRDDCSTGSGALLVHCSWDGSAWQSLSLVYSATTPASSVVMGDAETLQTKFDEGDMQSAIRTVVAALPGAPTDLNQTYIVTDAATLDDCSTGAGSLLSHCSWDGSAWQSLGGSQTLGAASGNEYPIQFTDGSGGHDSTSLFYIDESIGGATGARVVVGDASGDGGAVLLEANEAAAGPSISIASPTSTFGILKFYWDQSQSPAVPTLGAADLFNSVDFVLRGSGLSGLQLVSDANNSGVTIIANGTNQTTTIEGIIMPELADLVGTTLQAVIVNATEDGYSTTPVSDPTAGADGDVQLSDGSGDHSYSSYFNLFEIGAARYLTVGDTNEWVQLFGQETYSQVLVQNDEGWWRVVANNNDPTGTGVIQTFATARAEILNNHSTGTLLIETQGTGDLILDATGGADVDIRSQVAQLDRAAIGLSYQTTPNGFEIDCYTDTALSNIGAENHDYIITGTTVTMRAHRVELWDTGATQRTTCQGLCSLVAAGAPSGLLVVQFDGDTATYTTSGDGTGVSMTLCALFEVTP